MTSLAAVLVLTLAAGPSDSPRRTGVDATNAARARAGLLPRKAARTRVEVRGLRTVRAPAPTFLGEPGSPAEGPAPDGSDDAVAESSASPEAERFPGASPELLVPARGAVVTAVVRGGVAAPEPIEAAAAEPPVVAPPEEVGAVRMALVGVATEVTLRMLFDQ